MKLDYINYTYLGATLEIPEFLLHLWPDDLALESWPTYCGAGGGIGDWIVSDHICGVYVSPCCFVHDLDFSLLDNTWADFFAANMRFYTNLRALVYALADREKYSNWRIEMGCLKFFVGVMTFGWRHFKRSANPVGNPLDNATAKDKLHRLALATLGVST